MWVCCVVIYMHVQIWNTVLFVEVQRLQLSVIHLSELSLADRVVGVWARCLLHTTARPKQNLCRSVWDDYLLLSRCQQSERGKRGRWGVERERQSHLGMIVIHKWSCKRLLGDRVAKQTITGFSNGGVR